MPGRARLVHTICVLSSPCPSCHTAPYPPCHIRTGPEENENLAANGWVSVGSGWIDAHTASEILSLPRRSWIRTGPWPQSREQNSRSLRNHASFNFLAFLWYLMLRNFGCFLGRRTVVFHPKRVRLSARKEKKFHSFDFRWRCGLFHIGGN